MSIIFKPNKFSNNLKYLIRVLDTHPEAIFIVRDEFIERVKNKLTEAKWIRLQDMNESKDFNEENMKQNWSWQLHILKTYPYLIYYLKNPTEDLIIRSLKIKPMIIQNIINPTEDMWLTIVKRDGLLIRLCEDPTEKIRRAAFTQNKYALDDFD